MPQIFSMRLQKYISRGGYCSRRRAEKLIAEGKVTVNGKVVDRLGSKVDPEIDRVAVDGHPVSIDKNLVYIVLNKPRGYVASCDHPGQKIVLDLVNIKQRVYPVGRLDKDSTGLLLLTNDGRLHQRLTHPSFDHEKEYLVSVSEPIPAGALKVLAKGVKILGKKTRPARVKIISPTRFKIILKEGRNRQIRRMVRKVGNRVVELKRIRVANIRLGNLAEGKWRRLSEAEKKQLIASALK
jgi:23S rRNA pseudouridine2605 synthase/23S rRNA pseudouridine2604 synthase